MELNDYQTHAIETVCYDDSIGPYYSVLGLCGEAGEVADKLKKIYRDKDWKNISQEDKDALKKELGDVLWYIAKMADDLGFTLNDVAKTNLDKIRKRQETNTLHGQGDDREIDLIKIGDHVKIVSDDAYNGSTGVVDDLGLDTRLRDYMFKIILDRDLNVLNVFGRSCLQKIDV